LSKLRNSFIFLLISLVLVACGTPGGDITVLRTRVNHVVLCWLKQPANDADRNQIVEISRSLQKIPGVLDVRVGKAIPSDRKIVDDSFDVGIYFSFESVADMERYLKHPQHISAVKNVLAPLTSKIVVYDFYEPDIWVLRRRN